MKKFTMGLLAMCCMGAPNLAAEVTADLVIKKGTPIYVDGKADDPVWAAIEPVAIDRPFQTEEPSLTAYFKMYYTDESIGVLVDVDDDVHYPLWRNPADKKQNYMYDKVEVYFDVNDVLKDGNSPAHNGKNDPPIAPGHAQLAFDFDDEGGYDQDRYMPSDVVYNFLDNQVYVAYSKKENGGYTIEYDFPMNAYINDKNQALDVEAFKALPNGMGFDITIVDNDNDGKGRKRMVWRSDKAEAYQNMDGCGVVVFSSEELPVGGGIHSASVPAVRFYPNPVKETLTVEGDFDTVVLVNLLGQQVKKSADRQMNVADLAAGVYVIKTYKDGACSGVSKITKE